MADQKTDAEKTAAAAHDAETKAAEARVKEADADKSRETKAAEKAEAKADDKRAEAEEAKRGESGEGVADTVKTARVAGPLDPSLSAGDHFAQKFGNDPANPKPAPDLAGEPTVRLTRITPDKPDGPVETFVHEKMVGDYLRAGWSRA